MYPQTYTDVNKLHGILTDYDQLRTIDLSRVFGLNGMVTVKEMADGVGFEPTKSD